MSKRARNADYVDSWFSTLNASSAGGSNATSYRPVSNNMANAHSYGTHTTTYDTPQHTPRQPVIPTYSSTPVAGASNAQQTVATPLAGPSQRTRSQQARGPGSAADPIILDLDSPPRLKAEKLPPAKKQRLNTVQPRPESVSSMQPEVKPAPVPPKSTDTYSQYIPPAITPLPLPLPSKPSSSKSTAPSPHIPAAPVAAYAPAPIPAPTPSAPKGKGKQRATQPSASQPAASQSAKTSQPKASQRQAKAKPEKRLAMMRKTCSQATRERLERVTLQRFFLIDRKRVDDDVLVNGEMKKELKEEFQVLGSTGNVYTVVIGRLTKCDCPDSIKGNHCKHILFVFAKVLQVPYESHYWYQKALLTSELEDIFASAPIAPNDVTNPRVRDAYARATGLSPAGAAQADGGKKKAIEEGTECPICYEDMFRVGESQLVFCETSCGNALHKECFGQWAKTKGAGITCPYCRAKWPSAKTSAPRAAGGGRSFDVEDRYLNLANAAGLTPERDTSTYYHGPRRGQRAYGFQLYDDY